MFYHADVLKKGGKFYICWIADCYPEKFSHMPERFIRKFDIVRSCCQLNEVINTESRSPYKRFSLRLSSQLLMGIMRIYLRQVNVLISDVLHFNQDVRRAIYNKQHPKIPKKPKPVRHIEVQEQEIPQEVVALLNNATNVVHNVDAITLREEVIPPTIIVNDGFGDEMDPSLLLMQPEDIRFAEMTSKSILNITEYPVAGISSRTLNESHLGRLLRSRPAMMQASPNKDVEAPNNVHDISCLPTIEIQEIPAVAPIEVQPDKSAEAMVHSTPARPSVTQLIRQLGEGMQLDAVEARPKAGRSIKSRKKKPFKDQDIVIDSEIMRARQTKHNVEMRCQTAEDDRIDLSLVYLLPAAQLFDTPCTLASRSPVLQSQRLGELYRTMLITRQEVFTLNNLVAEEAEVIRAAAKEKSKTAKGPAKDLSKNQTGDPHKTLLPIIEVPEIEKTTSEAREMTVNNQDVSLLPQYQDITMLPNIDISNISKELGLDGDAHAGSKRASEADKGGRRKSARISRMEDQAVHENAIQKRMVVVVDVHRAMEDSVPTAVPPAGEVQLPAVEDTNQIQELPVTILPQDEIVQADVSMREQSKDETGLGSLDRTQVELGDEENDLTLQTKEAYRQLDEDWDARGLLNKIIIAKTEGIRPINIERLVKRFYTPPPNPHPMLSRRIVAARTFVNLLKMKKHNIVEIVKKPDSLEIGHIRIGRQLKESARSSMP